MDAVDAAVEAVTAAVAADWVDVNWPKAFRCCVAALADAPDAAAPADTAAVAAD